MSSKKTTATQRLAGAMQAWREGQGITSQRVAGERCGLPGTVWYKLEAAEQNPRLSTLVKLAAGGVDLSGLFK